MELLGDEGLQLVGMSLQSSEFSLGGRRNGRPVAEVDPERFAKSSWSEIHNTILEHFTRMALNLFSSIGFVPLCASTTH
eukprot:1150776-Pelagomonas_calceolata.AAC.12